MYDLLIIGAGPAGVSAAVYAARKQLKTALVAPEFGGQSIVSSEIFNWIGTPRISGTDLAKNLATHTHEYEGEFLTILTGASVVNLEDSNEYLTATLSNNKTLQAETVLVASGSQRRKLSIRGADIFENKGVVYCASCDGPLFSGADVVVIGGGNAGFESAAQLLAYTKSVTLIHRSSEYKADVTTIKKVLAHPNMTGLLNTEPIEIIGDGFVSGVKILNKETGTESEISAQGVFVEIGQIPNTDYLENLVNLDEHNRVIIDPWRQKSSHDRIWAAGDCSNILYHQNNIAAGDGVRALEDIYLYLKA